MSEDDDGLSSTPTVCDEFASLKILNDRCVESRNIVTTHTHTHTHDHVILCAPVCINSQKQTANVETNLQVLVDGHDGREVPEAVAVVGRAPDGRERVAEELLVALHAELVRAADVVQFVQVEELLDHVFAEDVPGATRGLR